MRLGPGLLYEGRTLQGARPKLADFCSATMAEFYSAVDKHGRNKNKAVLEAQAPLYPTCWARRPNHGGPYKKRGQTPGKQRRQR